jgi:glycosyltransferase involved in cell wall biosynthesis
MAPNPRLTVLHGIFSTYLSWSQPFIYRLLTGLSAHVQNVVICGRTENLEHYPLPNVVTLRARNLLQPAHALVPAASLARAWRPDVIHGHLGWSALHMVLLKQYINRPLVTTFGGRDVAVQRTAPQFARLYGALLDSSDRIVCVSEDLRRRALEAGADPERTVVIRRGTDLRHFRFVDRSARDPRAPLTFLTVGRLVEKKGHRHVLAAFAALANEGVRARLVVIGDGQDASRIRRERDQLGLRDLVTFLGRVRPADVFDHLCDADVLLHCSVTGADGDCEGIPNAIVEAAATGLPVIATRHAGIVEAVDGGRTGLLVPEGDVSAMIAAMRRLATSPAERSSLGHRAGELMRERFDLNGQVARHVELYEQLAADARRGASARRLLVPEDLGDVARRAFVTPASFPEMSLLDMLETAVDAFGFEGGQIQGSRLGLLGRLVALKEGLPTPVRRPMRAAVAGALAGLLATRRGQRGYERWLARCRGLDRRVLRHFALTGDLATVPQGWTIRDVDAFLAGVEAGEATARG